jgi:HAD superfamily hydrolase (TIGR01509 family)
MPALRAFLFDLDGVLIDSFGAWLAVANQAAAEFGLPAIAEDVFRRSFGQSSADDVDAFYPGRTAAEVDAFFGAHFRDHLRAVTVNPDAPPLLARARAAGLRLACVTNTSAPLAREILEVTRLGPLLDAALGAGPPHRPKPAPDLVRAALRALEIAPDEALLVGDTRYDVQAGRSAGVLTVGLGTDADERIETLGELARFLPPR